MKTALMFFKAPDREYDGEYYSRVIDCFRSGGIDVSTILTLSLNDDLSFRHSFENFKNTVDNLVIIVSEDLEFNFKEIIAEKLDTALIENENAKIFLDAVCTSDGLEYSKDYATMPLEATVIPNIKGAFQGFIIDEREFTAVCLPSDFVQLKPMCDKYALPYLEKKFGIENKRLTLKYFGDLERLDDVLTQSENIYNGLKCNVYQKYGDVTIDLLFPTVDEKTRGEVVRYIVSNLKENIYAEFDSSLGERLFDLLKLKNIKLSVAESFTGGRIVSELIKNSGASKFIEEGAVTYSNESKISRLKVDKGDLEKNGAVSSVVAYQMAKGLLKSGNCEMAISTTGIAGPKSDDTDKPVGLCYIGIGMLDVVHTYKLNLSGSREEITETAKNTALFLAIKKLKNI